MRKVIRILSVAALLLAVVMAISSCNIGGNGDTGATNNDYLVKYPEINYQDRIYQWTQYIEYVAPENVNTSISETEFVSTEKGANVIVSNGFVIVSKSSEVEKELDPSNPDDLTVVLRKENIKIYDLKNSESPVKEFNSVKPVRDFLNDTYYENKSPEDYIEYRVNVDLEIGLGGIIEVAKTKNVLKEQQSGEETTAEELDPDKLSSYETSTVYAYYRADGSLIAENMPHPATVRLPANESAQGRCFLFDTTDKTLLLDKDGNELMSFALKEEYDVPFFDEDKTATEENGYAYFTVGDYKYVLTEAAPYYQMLGEVVLYVVPGMSVRVMDSDYNSVYTFETDCYHVAGYAVMPNGNLYVCEYELLPKEAEEYEFMIGEEKFNVNHTIINVADGTSKNIDVAFVSQKIFNNATTSINSLSTLGTLNAEGFGATPFDNCKVKDGYMLAEIQKITEKNVAPKTVYAVLDEELNIVAELPSIIENQFGYASFVDENTLLVNTMAADQKIVNYTVDINTGEVKLYVRKYNEVKTINGGFFYNNTVYNKEWKEVCDFASSNYSLIEIVNGNVYYRNEWNEVYSVDGTGDHRYVAGAPMDGLNNVLYDNFVYDGNRIVDLNGNTILDYESYERYYDAGLYYLHTERVSAVIKISDGKYLAQYTVTGVVYGDVTYDPSLIPDNYSYNVYYIIK